VNGASLRPKAAPAGHNDTLGASRPAPGLPLGACAEVGTAAARASPLRARSATLPKLAWTANWGSLPRVPDLSFEPAQDPQAAPRALHALYSQFLPPDAAAIHCALIFRGEGEMTDPAPVEFGSERMIVPLIRRSGFEDRPRVPYHEGLKAMVGPTLRPWAPSPLAADLLGTHRADLDMRLRHSHSAGPDHPFPQRGSDQLPATRTRPCR
jgi:hypothetical protein